MKIDKTVYRYIEFELYHYEQYKKEIQLERERILDASPCPPDGQPKGNQVSNPTQDKAVKLLVSPSLAHMERTVASVDNALSVLSDRHKRIFEMVYVKKRRDRYRMSDDMYISYDTFNRNKNEIVCAVGRELGVVSGF